MADTAPNSNTTETADASASASECCYTYDVVIVGAGIIGLSIARHFLLHSYLSVAIVDASTPLSCAATGAGQGYLWMINKTPGTALWDLAMRSHQLWQMFVDTLQDQGIDPLQTVGWKKTGSLLIGRTKEESDHLKERVQQLAAVGLKAEYWPSNKLLLEEPELAVNTESCAAFLPEDDQIDVHGAVRSIEEDNKFFIPLNRYAEFYGDAAVCLLRSSKDGKIDGIKTNKNNILYAKKAIVVAAGAWTRSLMNKLTKDLDVKINVPVEPMKVYLLVFENLKSILTLNHATMEAGYVNYQRTSKSADSVSMTAAFDAKGNLLVGSSRQFVGFDKELDMNIVEQIWGRVQELFPALKKVSLESLSQEMKIRIGFCPYTPDGMPIIGSVPSMPNVYLATGHKDVGISMALGTAELIADMVLGKSLEVDPVPFAVEDRC
ncbi:uncharacterized protein LOC130796983 isoform X1 [Amaranthus tricolor]|uniref:uncharacterized protein LOC130796983 isoform X1 n=1 Tax=Amaranthus tricolor TaxID=29722 RepID=UPI00258DC731|nr:uncharacterized protein LOC130796983 isoform X1 [Amaranthus tricolor]